MNICIIGNSKRSKILAENLRNSGHNVFLVTNGKKLDLEIVCDFTVLPIPTLLSDGKINIPDSKSDMLTQINKKSIIIGYNFRCDSHKTVDLNDREDFAYLNAIPTAEGAICTALNNCDTSLFYSKILITGFGRVAKILADRLAGLKCKVTVAARSERDLSFAEALGYETVHINKLCDTIENYDIIFQTVPSKILTAQVLKRLKEKTLIVELSSKSVGTDTEFAKKCDLRLLNAAALPEKISPQTAGDILTECVLKIIEENSD